MKRLLLLSLLAALVVAVPAQARTATPCRDRIYSDWYADGKIASTYPHACYVDALRHVPASSEEYSSLRDDITAAMRAGIRLSEGQAVPKQVGRGFAAHNVLVSGAQSSTQSAPHDPAPSPASSSSSSPSSSQDPASSGQTANAEVATSSSGAPLPVLVLGGLALALVAAGAIGAGVKRARSRRG